jgi:uncharacterized protein YlxW (UPF0749 family)
MSLKLKIKLRYKMSLMVVCLILGFFLAWQLKSINNNNVKLAQNTDRLDVVEARYNDEKTKSDSLTTKNDELQKEIDTLKNSGQSVSILEQEITNFKMIAGLMKVKGDGIIVKVSNSKTIRVEEDDLLRVVNEMRASDIQAISINNQRLTATSEIRATASDAGDYVIINGNKVAHPYTIKAIADPKNINNALNMLGGLNNELGAFLNIQISEAKNIELPAVSNINADLLKPVY